MSTFRIEVGSQDGREGDTLEIEAESIEEAVTIAQAEISHADNWRVWRGFVQVHGMPAPEFDLAANPPEA
jgi:hypothetical protein